MIKYLLPKDGNFYKANLHVHTTVSDGEMTPEETKQAYKDNGYSIVAFTDHEVMVPQTKLTDDSFLAITSTEIYVNTRYDVDFGYVKTYHLNIFSPEENRSAYNTFDKARLWLGNSYDYVTTEQEKSNYDRVYSVECVNDMIKRAGNECCLVSYNHPVWSQQDYSDYIGLRGLWGVEVYNNACARSGYFDSEKPLDDLLRIGERVFPLATDDTHKRSDCFGGFVMIKADELKYDKIFSAMREGSFYASTGPEFYEISLDDSTLNVKSSPVSLISVSTDCRYMYFKRAENEPLTEASFDIGGFLNLADGGIKQHQYIRVTLVDDKGNKAYSRAYFMDELIK